MPSFSEVITGKGVTMDVGVKGISVDGMGIKGADGRVALSVDVGFVGVDVKKDVGICQNGAVLRGAIATIATITIVAIIATITIANTIIIIKPDT